jgi:dienelactone hydrolase
MDISAETLSDGVCEQLFTLGEIPGVLWTPGAADGTRPLIVMGHSGGQHKKAPSIVDRARRFVAECGFAVVAVDVPSHGRNMRSSPGSRRSTRPALRPVRDWPR